MGIINGEYPPGVFFKGSRIFGQKNKGSQILRRKFKGSQINFIVWPHLFQNSHWFLKVLYIAQKPMQQLHNTTTMLKYDSLGVWYFLVK